MLLVTFFIQRLQTFQLMSRFPFLNFFMWTFLHLCRERPSNALVRFRDSATVYTLIDKIFGAMDKDSYGQISEYFGIPSVEQLITNRHDRFLNRYLCQENYVCQALIM